MAGSVPARVNFLSSKKGKKKSKIGWNFQISQLFIYLFIWMRTQAHTESVINTRRENTLRIKHGREEKRSCSATMQHCQSLVLHVLRGWQDCFLRRLQSFSAVCGGIIQLSEPFRGQVKLFTPCSTQVKRLIKIRSRMSLLFTRHVSSSTRFIPFSPCYPCWSSLNVTWHTLWPSATKRCFSGTRQWLFLRGNLLNP